MQDSINVVDNIYNDLKTKIITNTLTPGEVISENSIAADFKVSRTPVREALKRLQHDGWVVSIPKIGIQISTIEIRDLREYLVIKKSMEELAIRLAVKNVTSSDIIKLRALVEDCKNSEEKTYQQVVDADNAFHKEIWAISKNASLAKYLEGIYEKLERWWFYMRMHNEAFLFFTNTFGELVDCMEKRDADGAVSAMITHIDFYIQQMRSELV